MLPPEETNYTFHIPEPCNEPVEVIFADDHLLVVAKPAGLLSVPGRIMKDCVLNRMLFEYPDVRTVHRLDLDTSGLIVMALTKQATSDLSRQFRERIVSKEYIALAWGEFEQARGEINLPIRPDWNNRPRQVVDHETGKASQTFYEVLETPDEHTRIKLMPVTGRSHQLRLHLAAIGHPLLGCDLYAHKEAFEAMPRLCLHASQLQFDHPVTGERLTFQSAIPF